MKTSRVKPAKWVPRLQVQSQRLVPAFAHLLLHPAHIPEGTDATRAVHLEPGRAGWALVAVTYPVPRSLGPCARELDGGPVTADVFCRGAAASVITREARQVPEFTCVL
jgi:hypothetical protein